MKGKLGRVESQRGLQLWKVNNFRLKLFFSLPLLTSSTLGVIRRWRLTWATTPLVDG
jgi:hypothetical protein